MLPSCTLHDSPWKTQCLGTSPLGVLGGGGLLLLLQFCSWLTLQPEGQEPLMGLRIWQVAELGYTPQALRGHLALKNNTTMLVLSGI